MVKKTKSDIPELGLIDPSRPTTVINLVDMTPEVEKFLNKVSKLSNHTMSSVIAIILATQIINLKPLVKAVKKKKKEKVFPL
jgi:hypothetical protein